MSDETRAAWEASVNRWERYRMDLRHLTPRSAEMISAPCVGCEQLIHGMPRKMRTTEWHRCRRCIAEDGTDARLRAELRRQGGWSDVPADDVRRAVLAMARRVGK